MNFNCLEEKNIKITIIKILMYTLIFKGLCGHKILVTIRKLCYNYVYSVIEIAFRYRRQK